MNHTLEPGVVIEDVLKNLATLPACVAGSVVASDLYDLPLMDTSDVDVFCYTEQALINGISRLLASGYTLDERHDRVWGRWLKYGLRGWHTNSLKLHSPQGIETNLVYKLVGGVPMNSLASVLESFDFGLLASGYDLSDGAWRDMRSFLFPTYDLTGPLPLMPNKREAWRNGFISQYNGLREAGRYAKYTRYGHDLSLVKDDLVTGYWQISSYLRDRGDQDKLTLAQIYETIALKIEEDAIDELAEASKEILTLDSLDQILEVLE